MTRSNDGRCDFCNAEIPTSVENCPECGKKQLETLIEKRDWVDWDSEHADRRAEEARAKERLEIAEPDVIAQRLSTILISAIPLFVITNFLIVIMGALFAYSGQPNPSVGTILTVGGGFMAASSGLIALSSPQAMIAKKSTFFIWSKMSSATKASVLNDFQSRRVGWILMGLYSSVVMMIGLATQL